MRAMRWLVLPAFFVVSGGVALADRKNVQVLPKTMPKEELRPS